MGKTLVSGEKIIGIFVDPATSSKPIGAGALWLDEDYGVTAEMPHLLEKSSDPFAQMDRMQQHQLPSNLIFYGEDFVASLYGCAYIEYKSGNVAIAKLRANEAVIGETPLNIVNPLEVSTFISHIDGLNVWSDLSSVEFWPDWHKDEYGHKKMRANYIVESKNGHVWCQGATRMSLITHPGNKVGESNPGIHLDDPVVLLSKTRSPRPISVHLAEHRKFRDLHALIHGASVFFRAHQIRDRMFPARTWTKDVIGAEYHSVLERTTVREHKSPIPPKERFYDPLLTADEITSFRLSRWAKYYEEWHRIIFPVASLLLRPGTLNENLMINASMSIEAIGQRLPKYDGEEETYSKRGKKRPTTATYFYRSIKATKVDTRSIAYSESGIASALADNYNTLKHSDRGGFPDPAFIFFAGHLTLAISRIYLTRILLLEAEATDTYFNSHLISQISQEMIANKVHINADGRFVFERRLCRYSRVLPAFP